MTHLLAVLPADEFARLKLSLEPVSLTLDEVIYESGELLEYIFFRQLQLFHFFTSWKMVQRLKLEWREMMD